MNIDPEFKNLIPPLTAEEYSQLEKNILAEGCRDALVTWEGTLIDGHNRYEICTKHGIEHDTVEAEFKDRQEVIEWIASNQLGRRNLPLYEKARLALRLKPVIAEKAKKNQRLDGGNQYTSAGLQKSAKVQSPIDTRAEVAKVAGVSHDTIHKVEDIEKKASEEVKQQRDAEKNKYINTKRLRGITVEELENV